MEITSVFSIAYLPPIQYLTHWVCSDNKIMEQHDNYQKQTYRNRCKILGANGVVSLIVPVVKSRRAKIKTKELRISYDTRWQDLHWRSIVSAYNSTPFFEYYRDDFEVFYNKKFNFLFDFNMELFKVILNSLDYPVDISLSEDYLDKKDNIIDFRNIIHPKKEFSLFDDKFKSIEYWQVFKERFNFVENLSVIDLIFNKGPEALDILEISLEK